MKLKDINGQNVLIADDGMVMTDGGDIFGTYIRLATGVNADKFYEITVEEYNRIQSEKEAEAMAMFGGYMK